MKVLKTIAVFVALLSSIGAMAQSRNIKALLLDESNGEALGFATVSLTREGQTKPAKYGLSDEKGKVTIESVRKGKYTFKAELLGYISVEKQLEIKDADIDLGEIKLKVDSEQLDGATVSALGNQVTIKKDTIEYNATTFRTTDNDVLEDLLKKLPGVEVSDDGAVTVNGESVSKITIDGKTFFLDDPQMASKNIPAKLVNKLKVIKKKSEQAEFTGIDDGQEETVIDLSVKPGMMKGIFGNALVGAGRDIPSPQNTNNDTRYMGNAFIGRFDERTQISLILNSNNTNNQGSTNRSGGMMRGMMGGGGGFGGGGGITTSHMAGLNGAGNFFDNRMEAGGNYVFNTSNSVASENSLRSTFLPEYNLDYFKESSNVSKSLGHNFGIRFEHKFSDNTSILFQPQINFGTGSFVQESADSTYNDNLSGTRYKVNDAFSRNTGDNKNASAGGFLLFRQRLGLPGRTFTAMINANFSNNQMKGLNSNGTFVYDKTGAQLKDQSRFVNQDVENRQKNSSFSADLTYTEPMGNYFYLEAHYSYSYDRSESAKDTYDLLNNRQKDYTYSNEIKNENQRQTIGFNALFQNEKLSAQLGFSARPTKTYNSTTKYNKDTKTYSPREYSDLQWNFSPELMVFSDLSESTTARFFYRGNSSQPSINQLAPVPDNTDPLNISFGNPTLKPYFSHNINGDLRYSNRMKFSSFNIRFNAGYVDKPIVNTTWYGTNGGQYSIPFNGPSSFNANVNMFANVPIGSSPFSINGNFGANFRKSSSFVGNNIDMSLYESDGYYAFMDQLIKDFSSPDWHKQHIIENTTRTFGFNERLRFVYRGPALELSLSENTRMNKSLYSITTKQDKTTTWNNSVSASVTWNWQETGISFESDFDYNWYRGYTTAQPSEAVLNAEISKLLFNNNVTLAIRGYDILGQSKNLTVSDNSNYHNESVNNTLGRYIIVSLTWRFGTMSNRGGRGGRGPMGGGRGPGMGGPGMGGGRGPR